MAGLGVEEIQDAQKRMQVQSWDRRKLGLELRQKYEMYFVALAFTLAGLAVQSAKPAPLWAAGAEIAGWVLLAVAGCIGLWRVSQMWLVLVGVAEQEAASVIQPEVNTELTAIEQRIRWWSRPQFGVFAVGLVLLVVARATAIIGAG